MPGAAHNESAEADSSQSASALDRSDPAASPRRAKLRPFTRDTRLRNHRDLQRIRDSGRDMVGTTLVLKAMAAPDGHPRLAILLSRRFCTKAVVRNRARRLLRECYRRLFGELSPAWVLFIPRQGIRGKTIHEVFPEVIRLFVRHGLLPASFTPPVAAAGQRTPS